jgi:hypothetical protein
MADTKISALTAATDLTGADIPIVQGGANKKAASSLFLQPADKQTSATDRTAGRVALVDHLLNLIVPAQLGSELLTNPNFTTDLSGWSGANWDWAAGSLATHTTGATAALTQSISVTSGTTYQLEVTITGRTAGSVTISLGSAALVDWGTTTDWSANTTIQRTLVASESGAQAFSITPTSDFNGSVSVCSVKAQTATAIGAALIDSTGATAVEVRGNASRSNTIIGIAAGRAVTTGSLNSFFGRSAGQANTTGSFNSFFGTNAGQANTTGTSNSFFGRSAGQANTTGSFNSFFGTNAGLANTTGTSNSFFGRSAGQANTTGTSNSFFGANAGQANTTGSFNSFFGTNAGLANTTGSFNSFFGTNAGLANTTGTSNSFFGRDAGRFQADGTTTLTTVSNCVYLGANVRGFSNADSNSIVIGTSAIGRGANTTTFGTSSTTNTAVFGDYESLTNGGGMILRSPDGTRYKITVANGGTVNVAAA